MPIKNLILDWSGTVVDDLEPVWKATNEIFLHYQVPIWSKEEFKEKFYLPFTEFYKQYLPQATLPELDFHYHRAFRSLKDEIPLLPYAKEVLDYARSQNMKIFLLSTVHHEHWEKQADILRVREYFTHPYTNAIDKREVIMTLLEEHKLGVRETLYVGDMQHDIETAHYAGVVSCAVLTGYDSAEKLKKFKPELLFNDMAGVLGYLKRHRLDEMDHPVATVGALIFNENDEVLMIQTYKWSNLWGIPGGKIKRGETSEEALIREVKEETGLFIDEICYIHTQDCIDCEEFFKSAHFLLMNYTAKTREKNVVLNDEGLAYQWIPFDQVLATSAITLNSPTRLLIETVQALRSSVVKG